MNLGKSCVIGGVVACAIAILVPMAEAGIFTACCDTETYACTTRRNCDCEQGEQCNAARGCYGYNGICRLPNGECTDMDRACMPLFDCVIDLTCFSIQEAQTQEDPQVCEADEPVCYPDDEIIAEVEVEDASSTG